MGKEIVVSIIGAIPALVVAVMTLCVAKRIPRKVMVNQRFMSLTTQYRSPQMGLAIHCLFDFFERDCKRKLKNITKKYKKRFKKEIKGFLAKGKIRKIAPSKTLHLQRRLVAYYFWDLARLRFDPEHPRLDDEKLLQMVGEKERTLIYIILQMREVAKDCFAYKGDPLEPPDDEYSMNNLLQRLYDETGKLIAMRNSPQTTEYHLVPLS